MTPAFSKAALLVLLCGCAGHHNQPSLRLVHGDQVGVVAANRFVTPTGQILTPAGRQVSLPGMRPQALALSPDGRLLATSGYRNVIVLIDPAAGVVLQTVPLTVIDKRAGTNSTSTITNSAAATAVTSGQEIPWRKAGRRPRARKPLTPAAE